MASAYMDQECVLVRHYGKLVTVTRRNAKISYIGVQAKGELCGLIDTSKNKRKNH